MTTDNNDNQSDNSERKARSLNQFKVIADYIKQNKRFGGHLKKNQKLDKLKLPHKSLVFNSVAEKHAILLEDRVKKFISKHKSKSNSLRWITLLDSVIYMDVDNVMNRVRYISYELKEIQRNLNDVHIIGAYELEVVNFDFNTRHANEIGRDKLDEGTRNKILNSSGF